MSFVVQPSIAAFSAISGWPRQDLRQSRVERERAGRRADLSLPEGPGSAPTSVEPVKPRGLLSPATRWYGMHGYEQSACPR
jgi:hypothetical protein